MKNKELPYYLTKYFTNYLSMESGYSNNTIKSYRDTFVLLFRYIEEVRGLKLKKLSFELLNSDNVNDFLKWIEEVKGCSISSRNNRLAALKSFSNYVLREDPTFSFACNQILTIKSKKGSSKLIDYLSTEAIEILFKLPDINKKDELRDLALICILYESGARVQEIIDLTVKDINFFEPNTVRVTGKGKKTRIIPISKQTTDIIRQYIKYYKINDGLLFKNKQGKQLTRSGIAYITNKYVNKAKEITPLFYNIKMHPHVFRHSKAMHLLENNVNLIYIRDFLGHSSVTTTEIYAKCNPELKRRYIEMATNSLSPSIKEYEEDEKKDLLNWLKEYI